MEITTDLVEHLAELSRLKFDDEQIEHFKNEFAQTLVQVDKIENANLDNVSIKENFLDAKTELRQDEIIKGLDVKDVTKNAPKSLGNSVLVPVEII